MAVRTGVLMVATLSGCATQKTVRLPAQPSATVAPLAITRVGVEPKTIDGREGRGATIRYDLTHEAAVLIDLVDEEGRVVRQLDAGRQAAGTQSVSWDGKTTEGQAAPSGVYRYIINAHSTDYGLPTTDSTYDPSSQTGGEELMPRDFTFDPQTGALRWVMPKAGRVRLRLGLQGFPHLRTLLDWEPLEAGRQEVIWDGLDASGLIRVVDHPKLSIKLSAFALPDNTIIAHDDQHSADSTQHTVMAAHSSRAMDYRLSTMDAPYPPLTRPSASYLHAQHPRAVCHEPRLRMEFPGGTRYDPEGRPRLSGVVPVRVTIHEDDATSLINQRFEIALFEDLVILFEEEEATNPFTFLWETTRLTPGTHLLTINVLSYDDHYGVATLPVIIEKSPR